MYLHRRQQLGDSELLVATAVEPEYITNITIKSSLVKTHPDHENMFLITGVPYITYSNLVS